MTHIADAVDTGSPYLPAGVTDKDFEGNDEPYYEEMTGECNDKHYVQIGLCYYCRVRELEAELEGAQRELSNAKFKLKQVKESHEHRL